jgi:hypothetical protein
MDSDEQRQVEDIRFGTEWVGRRQELCVSRHLNRAPRDVFVVVGNSHRLQLGIHVNNDNRWEM